MKISYTYKDMPDKTLNGIKQEASKGLAIMAAYFVTTKGLPLDMIQEELRERCHTAADSINVYMGFRNEHPELFKN